MVFKKSKDEIKQIAVEGATLVKKHAEKYPETEVIMISGHATINIAVKATKIGALDFIEKPISLDKLIEMVNNALKNVPRKPSISIARTTKMGKVTAMAMRKYDTECHPI